MQSRCPDVPPVMAEVIVVSDGGGWSSFMDGCCWIAGPDPDPRPCRAAMCTSSASHHTLSTTSAPNTSTALAAQGGTDGSAATLLRHANRQLLDASHCPLDARSALGKTT